MRPLTFALTFLFLIAASSSKASTALLYPELVKRFYKQTNNELFWLPQTTAQASKFQALMTSIHDATELGLNPAKYHLNEISNYYKHIPTDTALAKKADHLITDAAIALCKDIYQGNSISQWISYDEISARYQNTDNNYLLAGLSKVADGIEFVNFLDKLEPQTKDYILLKKELDTCKRIKDSNRTKKLIISMNYYRWIWHFQLDSFIVVNIASATLRYYKKTDLLLNMRAILGQPNKRTPRFASYCHDVVLYPYWYMPHSIAVNEWLHSFKRNPGLLTKMDMVVLNSRGNIISPYAINWKALNKNNFPYQIREGTGCDNPLGVLKFNITSPYSVYMHDTNLKYAFSSVSRWRSHGCIRIQDPIGLANVLLPEPVDTAFLKACFHNQKPVIQPIPTPVPTFVVYMTAEVNENGIVEYYKDVYDLLK